MQWGQTKPKPIRNNTYCRIELFCVWNTTCEEREASPALRALAYRQRLRDDWGICTASGQSQLPLLKLQLWWALTWVCSGSPLVEAVTTGRPPPTAKASWVSRGLLSPHLPFACDLITNPHQKRSACWRSASREPCPLGWEEGVALLPLRWLTCLPPSPRQVGSTRGPFWHPGSGATPGHVCGCCWKASKGSSACPVKPQLQARGAPAATAAASLPQPQSPANTDGLWLLVVLEVARTICVGQMRFAAAAKEGMLPPPSLLPSLHLPCLLCSSCWVWGAAVSPSALVSHGPRQGWSPRWQLVAAECFLISAGHFPNPPATCHG